MAKHSQIEKQIKKLMAVVKETNEIYADKLSDKVLMVCISAIDRFYDEYTPKYYDRLGTLYNVYEVNQSKNYITVLFDSSALSGHRVSNDYIYNTVFLQGYHGGAWVGIDRPYYRTNVCFTDWGDPAKRSHSPFQDIKRKVERLKTKDLLLDTFSKVARKYY